MKKKGLFESKQHKINGQPETTACLFILTCPCRFAARPLQCDSDVVCSYWEPFESDN